MWKLWLSTYVLNSHSCSIHSVIVEFPTKGDAEAAAEAVERNPKRNNEKVVRLYA